MLLKPFFGSRWFLLAAVVACAAALRNHNLADVFLWIEETDFFNDKIFGNSPQPFLGYAVGTRDATTNTWGWPSILWVTCRLFGTTSSGRSNAADMTAVWFAQSRPFQFRLTEYIEECARHLQWYLQQMQACGYIYSNDWLPCGRAQD